MNAVVGSQYGDTTEAAESLIVQLHSQGKLTKPRPENLKIQHENKILKANAHFTCVGTLDLSIDTKNVCANL
jgi:hypothetical protein